MSDILEKTIKKAEAKGIEAEIFFVYREVTDCSFENNILNEFGTGVSRGVGIRVIRNNKLGFSSTNTITEKSLEKGLDRAISLANVNRENPFIGFAEAKKDRTKAFLDPKVSNLPYSYFIENARDLLNNTQDTLRKRGIDAVISGGLIRGVGRMRILNTLGLDIQYEKSILKKGIGGKAINPLSLECEVSESLAKGVGKSIEELSDEFVKTLAFSLKPAKVDKISGQVLFHPDSFIQILSYTLGPAISGENVCRGRSFLANSINKQIACEKLQIYDWGNLDSLFNSRPYDGEGMPTRKNDIIEAGILKSFIYDIEWGNRAGKGSTGNAQRSYSGVPMISLNSFFVPPTANMSLMGQLDSGFYVRDVSGAHTSNSVTGDFGVGIIQAYRINRGEIEKLVYGATIADNCINLLKSVQEVDNDIENLQLSGGSVAIHSGKILTHM
ncbi:MAG: TldD/PmbA family protein [Candidatus Hodarchaeota archaeon]